MGTLWVHSSGLPLSPATPRVPCHCEQRLVRAGVAWGGESGENEGSEATTSSVVACALAAAGSSFFLLVAFFRKNDCWRLL